MHDLPIRMLALFIGALLSFSFYTCTNDDTAPDPSNTQLFDETDVYEYIYEVEASGFVTLTDEQKNAASVTMSDWQVEDGSNRVVLVIEFENTDLSLRIFLQCDASGWSVNDFYGNSVIHIVTPENLFYKIKEYTLTITPQSNDPLTHIDLESTQSLNFSEGYGRWQGVFLNLTFTQTGFIVEEKYTSTKEPDSFIESTLSDRVTHIDPTLQSNVQSNPEGYMDELVEYLIEGKTDVLDQVKEIHDWIADTIAYDTDVLKGAMPENNPYEVIKSGKAVCQGYSDLFVFMCKEAGISAATISGGARGYSFFIDGSLGPHAWNVIHVNDEWLLIDVTWDAGYTDSDLTYVKSYNTNYLFKSPEIFLYTHYPTLSVHQFIEPRITKEEFQQKPYVRGRFFSYGLRLITEIQNDMPISAATEIKIHAPENVHLVATIMNTSNTSISQDGFTLTRNDDFSYTLTFSLPTSGTYIITLYARNSSIGTTNHMVASWTAIW